TRRRGRLVGLWTALGAALLMSAAASVTAVAAGSVLACAFGVVAATAVVLGIGETIRLHRHFDHTVDRLVAAQHELRHVLDDLPEALIEIDADGVIRDANAVAGEFTSRLVDELDGVEFLELVSP